LDASKVVPGVLVDDASSEILGIRPFSQQTIQTATLMIRQRLTVNREGVAEAQPFWSSRQPQKSELRRERPPDRGRPTVPRLNRLLVVFLGHQRRQFAFVRREVLLEAREDVLQTWLAAADRGGQTQTNDQVDGKEVSSAHHCLAVVQKDRRPVEILPFLFAGGILRPWKL
jgi:hypothetical protein